MTTAQIAQIAGAHSTTTGWVARCPGHDDRSPSMVLHEARDGKTLVYCHAGCSLQQIARGLDLKVGDFFPTGPLHQRGWKPRKREAPTSTIVEAALQEELRRIVSAESERHGFDIVILTQHRNRARAVVERRLRVKLNRERLSWHEIQPHALDPMWLACIDQAISVTAACGEMDGVTLWATIGDLPRTQDRVLEIARSLQRELTKEPATVRAGVL